MAGKLDITMKMFPIYKGSVLIIQTAYTCTGSAKAETITLYTSISTHCTNNDMKCQMALYDKVKGHYLRKLYLMVMVVCQCHPLKM